MSQAPPTGNPPPYSEHSGKTYPPPNAVYPTQPLPAGQAAGYAYPVQPGYSQAYGVQQGGYSSTTTTIVNQPVVAVVQVFRESPVRTNCPHCHADIVTATYYETGTFAWIACLVICLFGCWLGCCLIPFCVDGCKDVVHSCPNCRQQISRFNRM